MKVITVARKPLEGTVAKNALEHGTGGLNIDRSRLGTSESLDGGAYSENASDRPDYEDWRFKRGDKGNAGEFVQPSGRWPANLILEHHAECVKIGTEKVEGHKITHYDGDKANRAYGFYIVDEENRGADQKATNAQKQADLVVDVYDCHPDCPCVGLDEQSGITTGTGGSTSGSSAFGQDLGWNSHENRPTAIARMNDSGGASRYFKQVGGKPIDSE
jgi:hypothetical protein